MALSDCEKCWETPCSCGWDYRTIPPDRMAFFIAEILQYRTKDEAKAILKESANMIDRFEKWTPPQ